MIQRFLHKNKLDFTHALGYAVQYFFVILQNLKVVWVEFHHFEDHFIVESISLFEIAPETD